MTDPMFVSVTATLTIVKDGTAQTYTSTVMAPYGQEAIMLDLCWEQTRKQAETALQR